MASRIHVGNLPYTVTEDELRQLFGQVGTVVSVDLPKDRYTGRARGFGFVDMGTKAEADEAIRRFNGYSMGNRLLRVEPAKEREARPPRFGQAPGYRAGYRGIGGRERRREEGGRGKGWAA